MRRLMLNKSIRGTSQKSIESQMFVDNMWRLYTTGEINRLENPSIEKLWQMVRARIKERIETFDA